MNMQIVLMGTPACAAATLYLATNYQSVNPMPKLAMFTLYTNNHLYRLIKQPYKKIKIMCV